jgi:hypothetical protein
MAIGRISGQMLSSMLDRQSDLTFINNTTPILHLDYTGSKVGINTDILSETLTVAGQIGTNNGEGSGILLNGTTISAKANRILYVGSQVDLGDLSTVYVRGGSNLNIITTDGSGVLTWSSANVWLANSHFLQDLTISGSTISSSVTNGNVTIQGNGSGYATSPAMYVTNLTATNLTSANINGTMNGQFNGNLVGNVATPAQPYITSLGTLTGLTVAGNISAGVTFSEFVGDVFTNNIYGLGGNLSIHPQPGTVLTIDSTAAQVIPVGSTAQRPVGPLGSFRYNTEANAPEYFNGTSWISMRSEVATQALYGNNSQDTFLLNYHVSQDSVIVSINGTVQQPGVAYAIDPDSANYILFTEVPKLGDTIEVRFLSTAPMIEIAQQNAMTVISPSISYGTSPVAIDEFRMIDYRSAKYTVTAQAANGDLNMSEVMVMHNGVTAQATQTVTTGVANVVSYTTTVTAGNVQLLVQSALSGASLKLYKLYFPI